MVFIKNGIYSLKESFKRRSKQNKAVRDIANQARFEERKIQAKLIAVETEKAKGRRKIAVAKHSPTTSSKAFKFAKKGFKEVAGVATAKRNVGKLKI